MKELDHRIYEYKSEIPFPKCGKEFATNEVASETVPALNIQ